MGELGKSLYAYFTCRLGLFRLKISNEPKPEYGYEHLVDYPSDIPYYMGVFGHENIIYMVGGRDRIEECYSSCMFKFDLNKFNKLTIKSDQGLEPTSTKFGPMVSPHVIRAAGKNIYFLSDYDFFGDGNCETLFRFQSFDTTTKCFVEQSPPPFNGEYYKYGYFLLEGYIYLLVDEYNKDYTFHVFTFNTNSSEESEWKENGALAKEFVNKRIPAPSFHRGNIGLSDEEFGDDKTRVLVALYSGRTPIAYRVRLLGEGESFEPKSYRLLKEGCVPDPAGTYSTLADGQAHLAYLGGGRFCVIYGSGSVQLLMYVFKIDFSLEHDIQISDNASSTRTRGSSEVLSYRIFKFEGEEKLIREVYGDFWLVTSNEEEQERSKRPCLQHSEDPLAAFSHIS